MSATLEDVDQLVFLQRFTDARDACAKLLVQMPDDIMLLYVAGMIDLQLKDPAAAARCFFRILEISPNESAAYFHIGQAYALRRRRRKAVEAYREAVRCNPGYSEAHLKLAFQLVRCGEMLDAKNSFEAALATAPDFNNPKYALVRPRGDERLGKLLLRRHQADAYRGLANIEAAFGQNKAALDHYHELAAANPDFPWDRNNLLFHLAYNVLCDPDEMLREHLEYERSFAAPLRGRRYVHERWGDPERRLKVGYVSPDLRRHSVSYFFEPILKAHDRARVEVYCYAEVTSPDEVTERLKGEADHWRSTVGLSDEAVARQIHEDGIDVLVDLAGHTANSRLAAFAYKPAPVQATYLGYFTTTGLEAMDYWITDEVCIER